MWRFLAGVASALALVSAGMLIWRSQADAVQPLPNAPPSVDQPLGFADIDGPPRASERTREQKRFDRYDKDRNGQIGREEYLLSRRKTFAKLDVNGDGRLGFDEYAIKTVERFAKADRDRSSALTAAEFLTTKVARKTAGPKCPPPSCIQTPAANSGDDEDA